MDSLEGAMISKDELPGLVRTIVSDTVGHGKGSSGSQGGSQTAGWPGLAGKGKGGKPQGGMGEDKAEKRSRTVYFGNFPDDTKGDVIKQFIDTWTEGFKGDIEETYPIGLIGERGGARFKSQDKLWEFMNKNKGKLEYEALGTKVFANFDSVHDDDPPKARAVSKLVRAIIEGNGGDGRAVKEHMKGTSYTRGRVYFKGERVVEWNYVEGVMRLKGQGKDYEEAFAKLMGSE